jgi:hypothetical protein
LDSAVRGMKVQLGIDLSDTSKYVCVGEESKKSIVLKYQKFKHLHVARLVVFVQLSPTKLTLRPDPTLVTSF